MLNCRRIFTIIHACTSYPNYNCLMPSTSSSSEIVASEIGEARFSDSESDEVMLVSDDETADDDDAVLFDQYASSDTRVAVMSRLANRFGGRESFSDESEEVSEMCLVVATTNC